MTHELQGRAGPEPIAGPDPCHEPADPALERIMDPANSPLRPGRGVRRVNNRPVLLAGALLLTFLVIVAYVAVGRASPEDGQLGADPVSSARSIAEAITGDQRAGEVPAAEEGAGSGSQANTMDLSSKEPAPGFPGAPKPPKGIDGTAGQGEKLAPPRSAQVAEGSATAIGAAGEADGGAPLHTDMGPGAAPDGTAGDADPQALALSQMRLQMFKTAIGSRTTVEMQDGRDVVVSGLATGAGRREGPGARAPSGYLEKLEQLKAAGLLPELAGEPAAPADRYAQFGAKDGEDRWSTGSRVQAPASPFELRAGAVLPATLVTGINSDLPGQITALLAQDVRDTATGEYVLIPQASRLVGSYGADIKFGQERVLVAWQRIVFPDGKALDIGAMPGADGAGYAGFQDQVDNHYVRLFASAVLMSGISAGITISQDSVRDDNGRPTMSGAMTESLGQQLGQLSEELIRRQMNVAPTIEIRPGYRFNVQVTKDLTFSAPYRAYDYDRSIRVRDGAPGVAHHGVMP